MAGRLGDVRPGRVWVDCSSCKRSGRYAVASLLKRYGPDISTLDVLRHLTASCSYQSPPGSPSARKYDRLCLAAITLPQPIREITPVPPGVPYTIEVWRENGSVELHLATIYPLTMALTAFASACKMWPAHEITLRDRCRIVQKQERPEPPATVSPASSSP